MLEKADNVNFNGLWFKKLKLFKWAAWVLLALSFMLISFYLIVRFEKNYIIGTIVLSVFIEFIFIKETWDEFVAYVQEHFPVLIIYFCAVLAIVLEMYIEKGYPNVDKGYYLFSFLEIHIFRLRWFVLTVPALFYMLVWAWRKVGGFVSDFWGDLEETDRKLYLGLTAGLSIVLLFEYTTNTLWFSQDDLIYSIDSGFCYETIIRFGYYDIRHPIMSIITFPIWAVIHMVLQWFVPTQLLSMLCAVCLQLLNMQAILLVGFMIKKITKNRWVLMIYLASSPALLFTMFLEKYQLAVFLLVLYVYQTCRGKENAAGEMILATGTMTTSGFLYVYELFRKGSVISKIKRIVKIFIQGIALLICSGRIHLINPVTLYAEIQSMTNIFVEKYSIKNCFFSLTKLVHGVFLGLTSEAKGDYMWEDILDKPSIVGIVFLAFIILGILVNFREQFVKLCAIWGCVAIILFCVIQWGVYESPLFSIYFAWAFIPMAQKGFQFIIEKLHWKENVAYLSFLIPMFVVNIVNVIDIDNYLRALL